MNSNTHHGAVINQAMTTRVSVFSVRGAVASAAATRSARNDVYTDLKSELCLFPHYIIVHQII